MFRTPATEYLERKYFNILRKEYGVPEQAVSNEAIASDLPTFSSLSEAEAYLFRKAGRSTGPVRLWNGYWKMLLHDAMQGIPRETGLHGAAIYIGEVPDPKFNAEVTPLKKQRFLILIRTGLELFLFRIAKVVVASMRLHFKRPEGGALVIEPEIDMQTARSIILRNIKLLSAGAHELPMLHQSNQGVYLSAGYAYALQQFTIAHELGHVLQFIEAASNPAVKSDAKNSPLFTRREFRDPWNQEIFADAFATHVCEGLVDTVSSRNHMDKDTAANILFEAPYILFRLMEALERSVQSQGGKRRNTHPPAHVRKEKLLSYQAPKISPYYKALAEERWEHICALTAF